ncbi:hypothetical protein EC988_004404 [Linderina pennispora]|nr:hypothetical protein EC988_004404 [Linderina pennispora]
MPLPNDYGAALYGGVDAQRSMMGFYDSYGYGQFAGMNKDDSAAAAATATAAGSQPATTVAASGAANNLSQAGLFPQQMPQPFGMNPAAMPYYSPYYYSMMQPGGQFPNPAAFGNNPALAAAYGQPFMKQGMFPMYPGAAGAQQPAQQHQPSSQGQQNAGQTQQQSQKPAGAGAQGNAAYSNLNAQKAGHPYSHYGANVGGFAGYEQDPASLANSMQQQQQQFGLGGGIPGIFSSTKGSAGAKDAGAKTAQPAGTAAAEIGGTTYYNNPQQTAGYPAQLNNAYAQQGYGHHQQAYYPYAQTQQYQQPHMYQQPQQAQQPQQQQGQQQQGHPGAGKQYWEQK